MAKLQIDIIGGVRVHTPAGREIRIASRKAQALLSCLAVKPGSLVSREFLAGLLWDDSDPELARSSLRQALATLRRALPDDFAGALRADTVSVSLDAELATSDVEQFRGLMRDGSPGALIAAADRVSGILFEGLDARSPAFDQWMEEHRRAFRRQVRDALERVATQCDAADDAEGRVAALERLVAIEPVNERAQRELMEALARQGRYTDALRQYRICRDALRRDLDVSPEPATEALYRETLRRRQAVDPAAGQVDRESEPVADAPALTVAATLREAVVLAVRIAGPPSRGGDDPELARQRWSAAAARARAAVERLGGRIDRPSQGEVIAVFGLAALTGNEAERAAQAALELAAGPAVACGLAEGQVLPAGAQDPFPLTGRPVNLARELSRLAPAGAVTASAEVGRRLSDRYLLEAVLGDVAGEACRILSRRGGTTASRGPQLAGRRAEIAMMTTLLERVVASGRGRAVAVRGDAGIGKSSLLDALAGSAVDRGVVVHVLHVLDFGQSADERPVPALALRLLGLDSSASAAARMAAVDRAVADELLPADDRLLACDIVGAALPAEASSLLAAMDNAARERGRARVLHRLVERAATRPMLIVVEDVHWAEAAEIAQLGDLAAATATHPVLLALSTRADGDPVNAAWRARARGCPVTMLDLAPLADDEARELAATYGEVPADVVERCLTTASGHPLFLEQLLRAARAGQTTLPGSVRGLVVARIERLSVESQRVVHAAAVLGVRFTLGALRHLLAEPQYDAAPLESAGLLTIEGDECWFAHELIRSAVYESLLGSTRRELHRLAASWYESRDAGLHADHLAAADDPLAPAAYLRAAADEQRAHRLDRAFVSAQRARETARQPHDLCDAFAVLGDINLARGRTDEAIAAFRESIDLAATGACRARAWLGLATGLRIVDRYDEALAALDHAEQAMGVADPRSLARLWTLRGNLHFPRGEFDACLGAHQNALEFARQAESVEDIARALGGLGDARYQRGQMRAAHADFRRCVDLCEQHGLVGLRLAYLPMVSVTHQYVGEFLLGLDTCAQAATAAREASDPRAELLANSIRASIDINCAQYESALTCSERSLALAKELGARRFEIESHILRGLALLGLRERRDAQEVLTPAVDLARSTCPTYCGPWALGALAMASDDRAQVMALLSEGEQLLARGCVSHNYLEFYFCAIEVSLRNQEREAVERYATGLEAYTRDEPLPWADVVIARGRALAAAFVKPGGDGVGQALEAALRLALEMQFLALVPALREAVEGRPGRVRRKPVRC